jgi:hypothetical protein
VSQYSRGQLEIVLDQLCLDDVVVGIKDFLQIRKLDLPFAHLGGL